MSAPFRAQAYNRVVLLQTAAEWAETTDKVLQDYETGRETDTGYEKTGDGVSTWAELAYDDPTPTPGGVKVYRALLTQSGTDAPVATVLENTLGGDPVWSRVLAGKFRATLTGAFPVGKTRVYVTGGTQGFNTMMASAHRYGDNAVQLTTILPAAMTQADVWTDMLIEIYVYP